MAIEVDGDRLWRLRSGNASYVVAVDENGTLRNRYFGVVGHEVEVDARGPWDHVDVQDWEYPARGAMFQYPAVAVTFAPDDRALDLRYLEHEIASDGARERLRIRLADSDHEIVVDLHYEPEGETGVFRRWSSIGNVGSSPIELKQLAALTLYRPPGRYELRHLAGAVNDELHEIVETLLPGRKVLEGRRGFTGHSHQPWFMIGDADRTETIFGALEWSGSWEIGFESDVVGRTAVVGGAHGPRLSLTVDPGGSVTTAAAVVGVVAGDFHDASRAFHRYVRERILPRRPGEDTLPVVFEGFYISYGRDLAPQKLVDQARALAAIGVELLIVTAGWYAENGEWESRLGDWEPRGELSPSRLEDVADEIRRLGLRVGIWWPAEMISTDSHVFREHPDWIHPLPQPFAGPGGQHGTLVLNLARDDVYEHVRTQIVAALRRYGIDYWRTDFLGRDIGGGDTDVGLRHVERYYDLLDDVRAEFPDLIIENCAGGGGRLDLGLFRRTHTSWVSDNVHPLARLSMFMSGAAFVPPAIWETWVVSWPGLTPSLDEPWYGDPAWPDVDPDFHFRVAMMGHLGIGADVEQWPHDWTIRATHHIARYKELRRTIQTGDLYRLTSAPGRGGSGDWAAAEFVSATREEAVVFVFRLQSDEPSFAVRVQGLVGETEYEVACDGGGRWTAAGRALAEDGIHVELPARLSSALYTVRRPS